MASTIITKQLAFIPVKDVMFLFQLVKQTGLMEHIGTVAVGSTNVIIAAIASIHSRYVVLVKRI